MAETKELLALLKGLSPDVADKLVAQAQEAAQKAKDRAEAQAKLDGVKTTIADLMAEIIKEVKTDFDVKVRGGKVEVHLVGIGTGGRTVGAPKSTPIKDSGMSMRQLVETFTPDKVADFNEGDGNKKYQLAMAALKVKQSQA